MPPLAIVRSANAKFERSYLPVAAFIGGTSGIGKAMAEAFAHYTNGKAHIIIVGRNRAAAESIIASFPKPVDADTSGWKHEFIPCDILVMKNVYAFTTKLLERVPRLNSLVLCAGVASLNGREDTEEGIDKKLASRYYSRWALIDGLLPALRKAKEEGQDAGVISVLGAGHAPKVKIDDLGLKKHFSGFQAMLQSVAYNDLMVAEYAKREPEIAFTHIFPGHVWTPSILLDHWLFKLLSPIVVPLLWIVSISPQVCAEHMLYALFEGKKGMYRRSDKGDDLGMKAFPGTEEDQKVLWDHTVAEVKRT